MHRQKVVIADPNEEFRLSLAAALSPDFQVDCCPDGLGALDRIRQWEPDILVTELLLENMDGIDLLKRLQELPKQPKVMIVTGLISEFVHSTLEQLHVQYAMVKSCQVRAAAERVWEISQTIRPASRFPARYQRAATEILMTLQMPNERQGFQHLQMGLPLLMLQRDRRLSKELYEDIAQIHNSTPIRVEKAIRDTIHAGWESRDPEIWHKYFPDAARCPKNKEFLFRLTDILMERMEAKR